MRSLLLTLGVLSQVAAPVEPAPAVDAGVPPTPRPFGEGMRPPTLKFDSPRLCSNEGLARGAAGTLVVKCTVTRTGEAKDCKIFRSVPWMDEQTLEWFSRSQWNPVTSYGEPIEVAYVFTFSVGQEYPPTCGR
jgi:periplasmic protein TonB